MSARKDLRVTPGPWRGGTLRMPGDKSISHRIAMLASLAAGESRVRGFLWSEDTRGILRALQALGAEFSYQGGVLRLQGAGGAWRAPAAPLDVGNSGTGMRLLAGLLAGHPFESVLNGDESLRSRPMRRVQAPLELMGAKVTLEGHAGCAPMRIRGGALRGIEYTTPVASAQVKSCVLLAGLLAQGRTVVTEKSPTRDHTERLFETMGLPVRYAPGRAEIEGCGGTRLRIPAREWVVPGDFSSAAFWLTAAAGVPGRTVRLEAVGLNPRRTALANVLRRMGARIIATPTAQSGACETLGEVVVEGAALQATEVGGAEIPDLIDELPLVAVAGALANGRTVIRDAAELRVKETDRVAAVAANLRAMGVQVEEFPDGLAVHGPATLKADAVIESFGDHRMPMAFAVLAAAGGVPVRIRDTACVDKSYPEFWDDLRTMGSAVDADHCGD
jgi:3-phosphoshikimate 1-carboxyvinyltransferase